MEVKIDADELCELRRTAARADTQTAEYYALQRNLYRAASDVEALEEENASLTADLEEAQERIANFESVRAAKHRQCVRLKEELRFWRCRAFYYSFSCGERASLERTAKNNGYSVD